MEQQEPWNVLESADVEARRSQLTLRGYEEAMADKLDRLGLICRAIWELMRDTYNLSDEDLLNKVQEVDLLDGKLDGKVKTKPGKCIKCGRLLSKRRMRCIYCGTQQAPDSAFDVL